VHEAVVVDAFDGAPAVRMRRYRLALGAEVPRHTTAVAHEVHTVHGECVAGTENEEHVLGEGDSIRLPAGTARFRNGSGAESPFVR
jgi:quercetin dioxygenase-like cupin family protein